MRDIIDVVPGFLRKRPVLPPAGDPAIDQLRIGLEQFVGPRPSRSITPGR